MRIGELADACGVTAKTIRYYESIGLLPEPERTSSGYRSYGRDAVDRVTFVRDAQATGLSLTEIQSVLELKDAGATSCDHTRSLIERHLRELDEQIERLQLARTELAELAERARNLDPSACTDPARCQVIAPVDVVERV
jgi:DNA-binding transcriptional MerR regulator